MPSSRSRATDSFPNGFDPAVLGELPGHLQETIQRRTEVLGPGYNTSFFMLGWTPDTYDAHNMLYNIIGSRGQPGSSQGLFNLGNYSNKRVDVLIKQIQVETDKPKRQAMISEAMNLHQDDVGHIPLHQQTVVWAARKNVELKQLADNVFPLRYVKVQ